MTTRKEDILGLLEDLNRDLKLYEDPIYTPKEKEDIQRFGKFTLELFNDLKNDKYLSMDISKSERERGKRIAKFSKTPIDISNKLLKTREFNSSEQWYILICAYCWWFEAIRNTLSAIAMKLYRDIFGKDVGEYITLKPFLESFNGYKGGKYAPLFSDINADLRNAFSHGDIEFPNDKIFYYTRNGRLEITLEELLSKFKKLPPLCVYLFQNRLKPFKKEIEEYARKMGYL